nr:MAG TPA: hypothetical protein [Caudoviricetes sp.]
MLWMCSGVGADKQGRENAQKENSILCSLPIVKPCEYAII